MNNKDEDNIRLPDPVKIEKLIDDNYETINQNNNHIWSYDQTNDLDNVLEMSKNKYLEEEQKEMELLCNKIKEELRKEKQNKFNAITIQLNKIILFDRPNLDYYELVLSIIEMYELGVITEYKTNLKQYTNIFNLLKIIRIPKDEFENLKKLIICE